MSWLMVLISVLPLDVKFKVFSEKKMWQKNDLPQEQAYFPPPLPNDMFCIWTLSFLSSNHTHCNARNSSVSTIRALSAHSLLREVNCHHGITRKLFNNLTGITKPDDSCYAHETNEIKALFLGILFHVIVMRHFTSVFGVSYAEIEHRKLR